ncbi:hypothetical protein ACPCAG_19395 [Streptomyces pseudogriseolus]|uniref:hypothetical protein n=1 Tax=Streptomyces pseudogriseolus TaxID=36817 RepID=UPI003FA1D129
MFRHYDGTAWTKQDGAAPDGDTRWSFCTFHDLAQADDAGSFRAVGSCSTPLGPTRRPERARPDRTLDASARQLTGRAPAAHWRGPTAVPRPARARAVNRPVSALEVIGAL